jgi:hypothetical protein
VTGAGLDEPKEESDSALLIETSSGQECQKVTRALDHAQNVHAIEKRQVQNQKSVQTSSREKTGAFSDPDALNANAIPC